MVDHQLVVGRLHVVGVGVVPADGVERAVGDGGHDHHEEQGQQAALDKFSPYLRADEFDPAQLDAWVDRYFAGIKRPDRPIPRVTVTEPEPLNVAASL